MCQQQPDRYVSFTESVIFPNKGNSIEILLTHWHNTLSCTLSTFERLWIIWRGGGLDTASLPTSIQSPPLSFGMLVLVCSHWANHTVLLVHTTLSYLTHTHTHLSPSIKKLTVCFKVSTCFPAKTVHNICTNYSDNILWRFCSLRTSARGFSAVRAHNMFFFFLMGSPSQTPKSNAQVYVPISN